VEEDLISKRELLEITGISYGALYRWKRKKLIPDDWFIKKSTFTGQETFFEREKILKRIDQINHMKEEVALDDMASYFSPYGLDEKIPMEKISTIISPVTLKLAGKHNSEEEINFIQLLYIYIADRLLQDGDITAQEAGMAIETMFEAHSSLGEKPSRLLIYRKTGVCVCFVLQGEIYPCKNLKLIADVTMSDKASELKLLL
jgi:DNA-binding transcriptional MerR regulator